MRSFLFSISLSYAFVPLIAFTPKHARSQKFFGPSFKSSTAFIPFFSHQQSLNLSSRTQCPRQNDAALSSSLKSLNQNDSYQPKTLIPEENPYFANSTADLKSNISPHTSLRSVLQGLHNLYPPSDLEKRNAISRTDGYWTYINSGKEPPIQYTYGEFDFYFFADLLDKAHYYYCQNNSDDVDENGNEGWKDKVFCDIGSGTGRLVLAAAALHPGWKLCRGIEILDGIHNLALENLEKCRTSDGLGKTEESRASVKTKDIFLESNMDGDFMSDVMATLSSFQNDVDFISNSAFVEDNEDNKDDEDDTIQSLKENPSNQNMNNSHRIDYALPVPCTDDEDKTPYIPLAPISLTRGSFDDPYLHLSNINLAFIFSSCMNPSILASLSQALGRQCRPGTIIITTDYPLVLEGICEPEEDDPDMPSGKYEFEILDQIDGYCWLVGGITTAYIHVVRESLSDKYGEEERTKPELPLEEQARRIIKAKEDGTLTDTHRFLKRVHNNMVFLGLPSKWTSGLLEE